MSGTTVRPIVGFARLLRRAGLVVPPDSTVMAATALEAVGGEETEAVYWALRATLCRRPEDVAEFDRCFRAWFGEPGAPMAIPASTDVMVALDRGADAGTEAAPSDDPEPIEAPPVVAVRFSRAETLAAKDFATYTAADHAEARAVIGQLRVAGPRRRSARLVPGGSGPGRRLDLRRTVRAALRTDGEPIARPMRAPRERLRRLVLLCDVSGSMEPYSHIVVRFLHTAVNHRRDVEAFALGTRLTRLTRDLSSRDPDAAIARAATHVVDWSGGTRLGATLAEFNREWGGRAMARGAVVVIVSDGWDRGDPATVGDEMARLARAAHRVVWVNPLKASPGFAPLAGGMAAALPYVDDFVEGHSLDSLAALAAVIGEQT